MAFYFSAGPIDIGPDATRSGQQNNPFGTFALFLDNLLNLNIGLGGTSVDIGPDGSILALDTGIDTGTQLSLGNLLNVNTGLDGTQLSSVDIGPDGSILALDTGIDTGTQLSLGNPFKLNTGVGDGSVTRTGLDEISVIPRIPMEFLKNSRIGQSYRMGQKINARKVRSLY